MEMKRRYRKVHFVGIGGAGMSGIAEVLNNLGFEVQGSDIKASEVTEYLSSIGIKVFYGHNASNVTDVDVVVVSTAVGDNNVEVVQARASGIPVIKRAEMLAELMRMKYSIAVSGSHGKTTTTSMIGKMLEFAGLDPTVVVGGRVVGAHSGARVGESEYLVAEADESDMSFLKLYPSMAVITNIDEEHLYTYGNIENIKKAFVEFANKVPFYGAVIINIDWASNISIIQNLARRKVTYGLARQSMVRADNINFKDFESTYTLYVNGENAGNVHLNVPGVHNVVNSLAVVAAGIELDVPIAVIKDGLLQFKGVRRRIEKKGEKRGVLVVDDYGHHPTEIINTLKALKHLWKGRIIVVFQPHRYTRTKNLHHLFAPAFEDSDSVIILPIYPAGESPIEGVTSKLIFDEVKNSGHNDVRLAADEDDALSMVKEIVRKGDLLLTIGAGNVYKVGERFIDED